MPEIGKVNAPKDFDELFAYHEGFTWQENIERLVERTNNIKPNIGREELSEAEIMNVFNSPKRAIKFIQSHDYGILLKDLRTRCEEVKDAILVAFHIPNVNIRGRLIEVLITSDEEERNKLLRNIEEIEHFLPTYDTKNDLGDYVRNFADSDSYTDIKTKVLYLDSNPKAYNIDNISI